MTDFLAGWDKRHEITIDKGWVDGASAFTDSSSGAKTPTANQNTTVNETKTLKKIGTGSAYFNGSSRVYWADHADWRLGGGTGDFTVEAWVYFLDTPTSGNSRTICSQVTDASNYWTFRLENVSGTLKLRFVQAGTAIDISMAWTPSLSTWYHVAVTRSGNDFKLWVGGSQQGTTVTDTDGITDFASSFIIGAHSNTAGTYFYGYIDEFRISNSARYTTTFTPSTDPFTDDANTKFLLHFDPTDATLTDFPVMLKLESAAGINNTDITDIFDEIGANSLKLAVTTSDGQTQCYVEVALWDNANEKAVLYVKVPSVSGTANTTLFLYYDNDHADNTDYVGAVGSTPGKAVWDSDFMLVAHLCETPSGAGSIKNSTSHTGGHGTPVNTPVLVDGQADKALDFEYGDQDYVSFSKADRFLDVGPNAFEPSTISGAYYTAARVKIGTFSMKFGSGTTHYVEFADNAAWQLGGGSGDFTIEGWINHDNSNDPSLGWTRIFASQYVDASNYWKLGLKNPSGSIVFFFEVKSGGSVIISVTSSARTITANTWDHFALTRGGNTWTLWWNGSSVGTATDSDSVPDLGATMRLGYPGPGGTDWGQLSGYLDEFRMSNVARYSSGFTPSTTAFSSDANTVMLQHGEPEAITFRTKTKGTIEALITRESSQNLGYNIPFFYEPTGSSTYERFILGTWQSGGSNSILRGSWRDSDAGTPVSVSDPNTLILDTWYYAAVTANSVTDVMKLFREALVVAHSQSTAFAAGTSTATADLITIGKHKSGDYCHDGKIDEVRVSQIDRTEQWVKTTRNSLFDTLVSWGAQELAEIPVAFDCPGTKVSAYGPSMETPLMVNYGTPPGLKVQASDPGMVTDLAFIYIPTVAALVISANDPTMDLPLMVNLDCPQLNVGAYDPSMVLPLLVDLDTPGVKFQATDFTWVKCPVYFRSIGVETIKPSIITEPATKPSTTVSAIKPSATASATEGS